MTLKNFFTAFPIDNFALGKKMIIGATIGLVLITAFVLPIEGKPEWGNLWKIRPMFVVAFAGAIGGACHYFLMYLAKHYCINKTVAYLGSFVLFVFGIWLGTILGLDGTLWN